MDEQIVFGDRLIPVKLPQRTKIASPGLSVSLRPIQDLRRTIQEALKTPSACPPLYELAKQGWKVTIAFDNPTVPCFAPV